MGITKINEGVSSNTHGFSENKSTFSRSSGLVEVHEGLDTDEVFSEDGALVVLHVSRRKLSNHVDFDVGVKLSELSERSFSAGNFTNMLLS